MIPVEMKKEPVDFAEKVTKKAGDFLKKIPNPQKKDIDNRPYWRYALEDLKSQYKNICAYSGLYIPGGFAAGQGLSTCFPCSCRVAFHAGPDRRLAVWSASLSVAAWHLLFGACGRGVTVTF